MGITVIDRYNMTLCVIIAVGMQMSLFILTTVFKFNKVTDIGGSINIVVVALLTFLLAQTYAPRQIVITVLVVLWGVRLTGYLLIRRIKIGENCCDGRKIHILISALLWLSQASRVFAISLPIIYTNAAHNGNDNEFGALEIIGTVLFCFGLLIETIADAQKFFFRNNMENNGKFCDVGLWKWSRHPNYFGEIVLWWGIFIISCGILTGGEWAAVTSPLLVMSMILLFQGMPILERSSNKRYGELESYKVYKDQTSPLILFPPILYKIIPSFAQCFFCFEYPCYNKIGHAECKKDDQPTEKTDISKY